MKKATIILMGIYVLFVGCTTENAKEVSPNCKLNKTNKDNYELIINWEFINDTISSIEKIGWKDDWIYVYGIDNKSEKRGWIHIWDQVVVKKYGPIDQEQSYYGRKKAQIYDIEKAWNVL